MLKCDKKENTSNRTVRLLLLVTHACCLKCKYCFVQQNPQKYMTREIFLRSVDLLMNSSATNIQLHFFGGEPLMVPFKLLKETINYAKRKSKEKEKSLDVIITTNGVLLNKEKVRFFKKNNVILEISLDGNKAAQDTNRPQGPGLPSSYSLIVKNLAIIFEENLDCRVSMVVSPETVDNLVANFNHLFNLGFRKIFIMIACGVLWTKEKLSILKRNLDKLNPIIFQLITKNKLIFLNLKDWMVPFRMNTEIAVDFDGNIYSACISYLIQDEETRKKYVLGKIDDSSKTIDFFEKRRLSNFQAMQVIFKENNILDNLPSNIETGKIMTNFLKSLRQKLIDFEKNYDNNY